MQSNGRAPGRSSRTTGDVAPGGLSSSGAQLGRAVLIFLHPLQDRSQLSRHLGVGEAKPASLIHVAAVLVRSLIPHGIGIQRRFVVAFVPLSLSMRWSAGRNSFSCHGATFAAPRLMLRPSFSAASQPCAVFSPYWPHKRTRQIHSCGINHILCHRNCRNAQFNDRCGFPSDVLL
jgi:hypothetical protein